MEMIINRDMVQRREVTQLERSDKRSAVRVLSVRVHVWVVGVYLSPPESE